ncbi:MAG TPA: Mur ligase domain-containing protein, partial [Aestuariivirgaceae bacterium]|nr:Mur ligase domain-containing protein [Aestuariivirgaceae bacterium]
MTELWSIEELLAATGGRLEGEARGPVTGVSIDSRSIAPGDIFVAIKGDSRDGHEFAAAALAKGARLAIVAHPTEEMRAKGAVLVV